jgi:hypothetical protein
LIISFFDRKKLIIASVVQVSIIQGFVYILLYLKELRKSAGRDGRESIKEVIKRGIVP